MVNNRLRYLAAGILFCIFITAIAAPAELPKQITDEEFWRLVTAFSESGGYFRSENFVSNETTYQWVIPALKETIKPGGVYLGVGPDQNFTYIAALEPRISFIIDIRRQNMLQHLMYKALFELSSDRADFLSKLFSRPRPNGLGRDASALELFDSFARAAPGKTLFDENLKAITSHLTRTHKFALTADDLNDIRHVFGVFFAGAGDITYSGPYGYGRRMPTYAQLMVQNDGRQQNRSYLASDENFRMIQNLHRKNLIVPLVGDFAGPKTLRAVGAYLKSHNATASVIYTSNVEQYLFQDLENWKTYYTNIATLPLDSTSTFIRSAFNRGGYNPLPGSGMRSVQLIASVEDLLKAFKAGRIMQYYDVLEMSRAPEL